MKKPPFPQMRQSFDYDCGAKALQTVLIYYGIESREDKIMKYAGTSKKGTAIPGLIRTAKKYGLKTDSRPMTIQDLETYIAKKIPVIIALQAWTTKKNVNWEKNWSDGHYVVAIGYTNDKIIFADPASQYPTYLKNHELEARWHDIGIDGKKYLHHGLAIFGKVPQFRPNTTLHLD
jgi:ABC-type bacteriocin/lantibiotic exporter with double-glycine peptidase domain